MLRKIRNISARITFELKHRLAPRNLEKPINDCFGKGDPAGPRALLTYKTLPFRLHPSHPYFRYHQSMRQSLLIARVLDGLGYVVDVADFDRSELIPSRQYELVISHNFSLNPHDSRWSRAWRIYLASGTEHRLHNIRQRERLLQFEQRNGRHDIELIWDVEEMPWAEEAHAIFCFGNETIADTWRSRFSCPVLPFPNTALPGLESPLKNWRSARRHFLFLGSRQQLAKGLDLLLEAFDTCPHLHLHICGHYGKDRGFSHAYGNLLLNRENIHSHGWIDLGSHKAQQLVQQCGFVISPTCAEGSPGAITNAIRMGLIPLLSEFAGIDTVPGVPSLDCTSIETIQNLMRTASAISESDLQALSSVGIAYAQQHFTEAAFVSSWKQMIAKTLNATTIGS